ncbi:MAG: hypothetical protein ACQES8_05560 [Thermodesulfobacteriota bacterium]
MDKAELCRKITEIYPEIGECGINVDVDFNEEKKAWVVDLKKDEHELTTHLETDEANQCMEGKQCVSLGLQIGQLAENIKKLHQSS